MIDPVGHLCTALESFLDDEESGSLYGRTVIHLQGEEEIDLSWLFSASQEEITAMTEELSDNQTATLSLFNRVKEVGFEERDWFVPFLDRCSDGYEILNVVRDLKIVAVAKRVDFLKDLNPFVIKCRDSDQVCTLINLLTSLEVEQRSILLRATTPFLSKCRSLDEMQRILSALNTMIIDQLSELMEIIPSLLIKCEDGYAIWNLINELKKIIAKESSGFLRIIGSFLDKCLSKNEMDRFLVVLNGMRAGRKLEFLQKIDPFLMKCQRGYEIANLIITLAPIGSDKSEWFLQVLLPFLDKCRNGFDLIDLINALGTIEEKSIETLNPFFVHCRNAQEMTGLIQAFKVGMTTQRLDVLKRVASFSDQYTVVFRLIYCDWDLFWNQVVEAGDNNTLNRVSFVIAAVVAHQDGFEKKAGGLLSELLLDSEMREYTTFLLDKMLDSSDTSEVRKIARALLYAALPPEHSLEQKAIARMTLLSTDGPKNPYTLYKRLNELAQTPANYYLPFEEGVRFNPQAIKENAQNLSLTKADIPPLVTLDAWNRLSGQLRDKIAQTPQVLQNMPKKAPREIINTLESSHLQGLLSFEDRVSVLQGQFASLVYNVLQESDELKEGQLLSDREEALVWLAYSIQGCGPGKNDVIARAYVYSGFKIKKLESALGDTSSNEASRAISFVTDFMQLYLQDKLNDGEWLLLDLLGVGLGKQGSHQILYLKNLIGPVIGLAEGVRFDPHTSTLYNDLVQKTREEVFAAFYNRVLPSHAIAALQKAVNSELSKDKSTVFNDLYCFLGISVFELDEDSNPTFTVEGAKCFLEKVNFLG